jgi:hypothetical protein
MAQPRKRPEDEELELDLPALDVEHPDDRDAVDDAGALALQLPDDDDDPYDDEEAHDLPIELDLQTEVVETSAIGDDAQGVSDTEAHDAGLGIAIEEQGPAWTGPEMDASGFEDEDHGLGIDMAPREMDDGGHEGVLDPDSENVDEDAFPPLDGADDDDDQDELDVGIDVSTPED